jgi:hypothetical protein
MCQDQPGMTPIGAAAPRSASLSLTVFAVV